MNLPATLPVLLGLAWLLPLGSFALIVLFGPRMGPHGKYAAHVATGAILSGFVLSVIALIGWVSQHQIVKTHHEAGSAAAAKESAAGERVAAKTAHEGGPAA